MSLEVALFCLLPNYFHLVLWPENDGDLSKWMQWLATAHVRRYHRHYDSSGYVWQGRFRSFPIQSDNRLLTVMRYVERNPVRTVSIPVRKAQTWMWSSIGTPPNGTINSAVEAGPIPRRKDWLDWVN
ncbi:MAG: transposase [Mariniblastus sp.]|nr:transposase [Mariniblastus sp.]